MAARHPGRVLREDFMEPLGMSVAELAALAGVPAQRFYELLREQRSVSADTAVRLGRVFAMKPHHWMAMQAAWDLQQVEEPTDARRADLRGFVSGPRGVIPLPPRRPREPVDTSFPPEMARAVAQAAALLAPFKAKR
jgi:addiction module HigA family antidote